MGFSFHPNTKINPQNPSNKQEVSMTEIMENCNTSLVTNEKIKDVKKRWMKSSQGFAMQTNKTKVKLSSKHHLFLNELFEEGEKKSGAKYTPQEAEELMKTKLDKDGKRLFNYDEIATDEQIKGYWYR